MLNRIVVWDPDDEFWEGAIVDQVKERIINMRGGVTLPIDPELFRRSGVGGYMRRAWGGGWPLDHPVPKIACPMTMYVPQTHRVVHWAVRLMPSPQLAEQAAAGELASAGYLRLVGDPSQGGLLGIATTPRDEGMQVKKLGKLDSMGGWTLKAVVDAHATMDAHYGFGLYGAAPGLRVVWAAISATETSAQ